MATPRHRYVSCLISGCLVIAGCGGGSTSVPVYTNPIYRHDFPDPSILPVGTTYYAYASNAGVPNLPTISSHDLIHWTRPVDAMPRLAQWTNGPTWAPSVIRQSNGTYSMYYTGHDITLARQCIGVASATSPTGPFRDAERSALICPGNLGGAIDPSVMRDGDGTLYLYWKNDGNCCGILTHIYAQRLSSDGFKLRGAPVALAVNDQSWEGSVIEGPSMWKHGKTYFLFYSGGDYATANYAVGYSTCTGPMGPCTDYPGNPVLRSKCKAAGPGGEAIFVDANGATWMLYHAWLSTSVNADPGRLLWMDRLDWKNNRPVVAGPTCSARAAPRVGK